MGKPSDKRRAAQRPDRRHRARVKIARRASAWCSVGGVGTYEVKAGRKKYRKVVAYCNRVMEAHQSGDPLTPKSASAIKRPLYKIELSPVQPVHSETPKP